MDENEELRIVINGKAFRASRRSIKERLAGIRPERITRHYVRIDHHVYPIKQVFAVGLGVPLLSFTTQRAHAYLSRLGFQLGEVNGADGMTVEQVQDQVVEQAMLPIVDPAAEEPGSSYVANVFSPDGRRWQVWFRRDQGCYRFDRVTLYQGDDGPQQGAEPLAEGLGA